MNGSRKITFGKGSRDFPYLLSHIHMECKIEYKSVICTILIIIILFHSSITQAFIFLKSLNSNS